MPKFRVNMPSILSIDLGLRVPTPGTLSPNHLGLKVPLRDYIKRLYLREGGRPFFFNHKEAQKWHAAVMDTTRRMSL